MAAVGRLEVPGGAFLSHAGQTDMAILGEMVAYLGVIGIGRSILEPSRTERKVGCRGRGRCGGWRVKGENGGEKLAMLLSEKWPEAWSAWHGHGSTRRPLLCSPLHLPVLLLISNDNRQ